MAIFQCMIKVQG